MLFWLVLALFLMALGLAVSHITIKHGYAAGKPSTQIKDEADIAKSVFSIFGVIAAVFTLGFTLSEFALKQRVEDRQQLYGALGQLVEVDENRPEISAAAILQLGRLGEHSREEAPALIRIVAAYINENARQPVAYHEKHSSTRPDIQMAAYVLSNLIGGDEKLGELVTLRSVDLRHLVLNNATLPGIRMRNADISGASLKYSDLKNSSLVDLKMEDGDFSDVALSGAVIQFFEFQRANVEGTSFCSSKSSIDINLNGQPFVRKERCNP